jgi:hypothetical protein
MFSTQAHMDGAMASLKSKHSDAAEIVYTATFVNGELVDNSTTITSRMPTSPAPAVEEVTAPDLNLEPAKAAPLVITQDLLNEFLQEHLKVGQRLQFFLRQEMQLKISIKN